MGYDRLQFVENIESIQGINFIRQDSYDGIAVRVYEGLPKHIVVIDYSDIDEDVTEDEGTGILNKLGLNYLVTVFFPPRNEQTEQGEEPIEKGG